jgi:uncharacterized protein
MSHFLIMFITVYSSMHAFFYLRARVVLPPGTTARLIAILFLTLMVFAPILTRLLERRDYDLPARLMAHVGYSWMGFLFIAFCGFLFVFVVHLLFKGVHLATGAALPSLSGKGIALAILIMAAATFIYGFFEARTIRLERVVIATAKLPQGMERLTIAQISDVHLGLLVGNARMTGILDKVRAAAPDILVCTGDLVDGNIDRVDQINMTLNEIEPRFGKYAVTGNHEQYAGLGRSLRFTERFGFKVLRGETHVVENIIRIVGVDDPATGPSVSEHSLLAAGDNGLFTLLLKHRPEINEDSLGLFDLQLSGHTHLGQIFPFRCVTRMVYPMQNGFYQLDLGSMLYTSRGSGTWGPPIRVLAPPEVTLIELIRK